MGLVRGQYSKRVCVTGGRECSHNATPQARRRPQIHPAPRPASNHTRHLAAHKGSFEMVKTLLGIHMQVGGKSYCICEPAFIFHYIIGHPNPYPNPSPQPQPQR